MTRSHLEHGQLFQYHSDSFQPEFIPFQPNFGPNLSIRLILVLSLNFKDFPNSISRPNAEHFQLFQNQFEFRFYPKTNQFQPKSIPFKPISVQNQLFLTTSAVLRHTQICKLSYLGRMPRISRYFKLNLNFVFSQNFSPKFQPNFSPTLVIFRPSRLIFRLESILRGKHSYRRFI